MLFNSFSFAVFLPIVFILYWCIPHKYKWILMLAASYYFYMSWDAKYVILIAVTTLISYAAGRLLEKENSEGKRKTVLAISAVVCLGILFFFKYFNFVSESINDLLGLFAIRMNPLTLKILLPVGISFYTFQTLGYVIDVYRGKIKAEHHLGYYAVFVSFFPQIAAGPIARAADLLPQLKKDKKFDYDKASYGLKQMAVGFFKKLIIADSLAVYSDKVFLAPQQFSGFSLALASFFFTIVIYCDFSGYSDIAIGTGKLMGIDLMTNFKSPYFSQSVKEFWKRWHISLSSWFRDYVYIPLGGNRVGKVRRILNLMITFLASGLWHGANWTFVVWGGIHGAMQAIEDLIVPKEKRESKGIVKWLRILFVFVFVSFAWIFFASNTIGDAAYVIKNAFCDILSPVSYLKSGFVQIGMEPIVLVREMCFILIVAVYDYLSINADLISKLGLKKPVIRWAIYVGVMLLLVFFSQKGVAAEFVYFQF